MIKEKESKIELFPSHISSLSYDNSSKNNRIDSLLKKYIICDMNNWEDVNADLIITDPPFGIKFNGKNGNYHRNSNNVVDGYVEWKVNDYKNNIYNLLKCIYRNLKGDGQALIFSGWNNSNVIHNSIMDYSGLTLRGKMYWNYNFAPACSQKPSHNVYEIYWITKSFSWLYNRRCTTHHCQKSEPNLTTLNFKRDYKINMPKYPTRLPYKLLQCIIEHFSNEHSKIFDPLCGSGMVGLVAHMTNRNFIMGDLNKNGRIVFNALCDYYLNKDGLKQDILLSTWWKK